MRAARFRYERPRTLDEALALLSDGTFEAALLSGGQSLMPMLSLRVAQPQRLIDLNFIPGLGDIVERDGRIAIGARARHVDILDSPLVRRDVPLLVAALPNVAHAAVRNRGTIGGSFALADPSAELPCCAACLDADIVALSRTGERRIPASDFFRGVYTTDLQPDELIVRVEWPVRTAGWRYGFQEVSRRHGDFAIVGVAVGLRNEGLRIAECRVAYCGVEERTRRIPALEQHLVGRSFRDLDLEDVGRLLAAELEAMSDNKYPAAYRLRLASGILGRLLDEMSESRAAAA